MAPRDEAKGVKHDHSGARVGGYVVAGASGGKEAKDGAR